MLEHRTSFQAFSRYVSMESMVPTPVSWGQGVPGVLVESDQAVGDGRHRPLWCTNLPATIKDDKSVS